jgi:hypothetical protein
MNKKNTIIILFALLGIFLLAGSASAAVDFPADEAGISAYVKAKASIDLNLTKSAFASIERETPDYIIGTVALTLHSEEQYPHVYVSTDGWVVAYYPKDRESSWILPWAEYAGGPISSTTLSKAVGTVATAVGGSSNGPKYYDFRYPDATKMMLILESDSGYFKVIIPSTFSTYAVDWSHRKASGGYTSWAYLNDVQFSAIGNTGTNYGHFMGQFDNGIEHTISMTTQQGASFVGLVLEYAE